MNFKLTLKVVILCFFSSALLLTTSCKDDDDAAPDRDQFYGTYSVVETCGGGNDTYNLTVSESATADDAILIDNLYNWGEVMNATINGDDITIPSQLSDGLTFSGSGSLADNTLTIGFQIGTTAGSDNCNAICTKQ